MASSDTKYKRVSTSGEAVVASDSVQGSSENPEGPREPSRERFWIRAISCIIFPPLFVAYFIWTYVEFLRPESRRRDSNSLFPDGTLIWWSWFVIGALGLNVSTYVLAGVEAGMLMAPRFGALSVDQLALHKDKPWSKISGWVQIIRALLTKDKKDKTLSWIWFPLFALSFLSWAFVFTGLTMETEDSFRPGKRPGLNVVGVNSTSFNARSTFSVLDAAFQNWGQAQEAHIPGSGALYFSPGRANNFNMTRRNTFPSRTEQPVFLAPQAELPVTGEAWGLMLQYQCKPITRFSDLKFLNRRFNSSTPGYIYGNEVNNSTESWRPLLDPDVPPHIFYNIPGLSPATISLLPPKKVDIYQNIYLIAEVAISNGVSSLYHENSGYAAAASHGIKDEDVLEIALWQFLQGPTMDRFDGDPAWFKDTIPELKGEHFIRWPHLNTTVDNTTTALHAIAVQCTSSSEAGTARLDGIAGTFHDFRPKDTGLDHDEAGFYGIPRFSKAVPAMFLPGIRGAYVNGAESYDRLSWEYQWLPSDSDHPYYNVPVTDHIYPTQNYTSVNWRTPLMESANLPVNLSENSMAEADFTSYTRPLRPSELQHAMEKAHKLVAASLMFHRFSTPAKAWTDPNLIACGPWTMLVPGKVPPLLVVVLLVLWAVGCVVLGALYGFRKRWDAFFSVKSMYWYCVKIANVKPEEVMRS
ncbi:hypothetical protein CC80DRAFT_531497 [Byssothecium circinans]|uniref:Uncharacterized protein n=1 Tax=Byssothecium circinans TaxID=147558 RepID=A0A6A5UFF3_9PLEO|nr:hypothetical protein CC80DRAFT_531497 [Byssothecium circinans]